ncbi:MAG TPA: PEP-CTERM sorting domain-containing protein [Roseiarcus sp.]|nr:PEP-CTERM sorting domain-containing protein [Roseiarcus sp.]
MLKGLIVLASTAFVALAAAPPLARAALVDTFSFSNPSNWNAPDTSISGQFTATVEPDGFIRLADLSDFSAQAVVSGVPLFFGGKGDLQFFSYDTSAGAGSFGFTAVSGLITVCSGAPSVFDPQCNPGGANPASARAIIRESGVLPVYTPDQTAVTLVSSVSTPEAPTWAMMLVGLAGLGVFGARRSRRGRAALAARRQVRTRA